MPETRILVAGDTHGNLDWLTTLARLAARHHCEGVLQLGDFGFWPDPQVLRQTHEVVLNERWLTAVAEVMDRHGVWLRVIDGNHDFHPAVLAAYPAGKGGIAAIRPGRLDWATRGARWEWCGVRFGALGGAYSIDKVLRDPDVTWWATEMITDEEVERLGDQPLDVLVTHDAPEGVGYDEVDIWPGDGFGKGDADSRANRTRVELARRATRPELLLHGHYHLRYSATMDAPPTRVEGLSADIQGNGGSWGILELPSLRFTDGSHLRDTAGFGADLTTNLNAGR